MSNNTEKDSKEAILTALFQILLGTPALIFQFLVRGEQVLEDHGPLAGTMLKKQKRYQHGALTRISGTQPESRGLG